MLEFQHPLWLFMLIPCAIIVGLFMKKGRGDRTKVVIGIFRAFVFTCLVLALANPFLHVPTGKKEVVFLIDESTSFAGQVEEVLTWIDESLGKKNSRDSYAVVAFGANPQVLQPLSAEGELAVTEAYSGDPGETDLEAALLFAANLFEQDGAGRIVLFTDGNETVGSAQQASRLLKELGIEVDTVPLEVPEKEEVALTQLSVSPVLYAGEEAKLTVQLESNTDQTVELLITLNDRDIIREEVLVKEGTNVYTFTHSVEDTGLLVYEAEIVAPADHFVENNKLFAVSRAEGRARILVVEKEESTLASILGISGFHVDSIRPVAMPTSFSHLLRYDSFIFNNVPATAISAEQMTLIERAVHDFGRGFLMIGGEDSFGLGGYFRTPIEELLPVDMEVKEKEKIPSLGLVIVLDRSSSMEGQKLKMAKEAAARTVELLREDDTFGLIAFDSSPWEVVPVAPIGDKEVTIEKIRSVTAGGGTEISSSLQQAYTALLDRELQRKHVILLTDGQAPISPDFYSLLERGREAKITLSTVAIGQDADRRLLEELAREGGGNFYDVVDETTIPAILSRETIMMTRTYIVDDPFYPVLHPGSPWGEIFQDGMPRMNAYIATTPKAGSRIILESHEEDPVLIQWQYGLGTTLAFTSDVTGKWSGQFPATPLWPDFIVEMTAQSLPKFSDENVNIEHDVAGKEVTITFKTRRQEPAQLDVSVFSDAGTEVPVSLKPVAPGTYEFSMAKESGLYFLNTILTTASGETVTSRAGFTVPYSQEFLLTGTNEELLKEITEITGGEILEDRREAFRKLAQPATVKTSLSLWLTVFAFLLLFLEIAIRRLGFEIFTAFLPKKGDRRQEKEKKLFLERLLQKRTRTVRGKRRIVRLEQEKRLAQAPDQMVRKPERKELTKRTPDPSGTNREEQFKRLLAARNRGKKP